MEIQLHIGTVEPTRENFRPIQNWEEKALGGLWTADYLGKEEGSDWVQFCIDNDWGQITNSYILYPKKESKILVINSIDEYFDLYEKYPFDHPVIKASESLVPHSQFRNRYKLLDYEILSNDYDGVRITYEAIGSAKFGLGSINAPMIFLTWDIGTSIHWLNWSFDKVESLGKVEYNSVFKL